jgi:hypothetical protein
MATLSDLLTYNFRGDSGTVVLGTSVTLNPDQDPSVSNTGTVQNANLVFSLPRAASVELNATPLVVLNPDQTPSLADTGTDGDVVLQFSVPRAASVELNATPLVVLNPNQDPALADTGTDGDVVLQFSVPRAPSFSIGTVVASTPGSNAVVDATNDANGDVILDFTLPRGITGPEFIGDTPFLKFAKQITADYTVSTEFNTLSVGELSINTDIEVTIPVGGDWLII